MKQFLILALVVAFTAGSARADSVFAAQPKSVVTTMQSLGYPATPANDNNQIRIDSSIADINFAVDFYGCDDAGRNCQFLELRAGFTTQPRVKPDVIANWNRDNLFGTAYLDEDGTANISYTVTTVGGLTVDNFADVLARWEVTLDSFAQTIGF